MIPPMTLESVLPILAVLLGGGLLGAILSYRTAAKNLRIRTAELEAKSLADAAALQAKIRAEARDDYREDMKAIVDALKGDNTDLREQISQLQQEVRHLNEEITRLQKLLSEYQRKA